METNQSEISKEVLKQNLKEVSDSAISEESIRIYELDMIPTNGHQDYRSRIENRFKVMYFKDNNSGLNLDPRSGEIIDEGRGVRFLAHCNGLFCISVGGDILLWNPCTKQTRKLPPPEIFFYYSRRTTLFFGLGYDSSSDDYKLVTICVVADYRENKAKVYSRNTDTWQSIQYFPHAVTFLKPGVYVKGCLYWKVCPSCHCDACDCNTIVELDLAKNSFRTLQMPNIPGVEETRVDVGGLDDLLVTFYDDRSTWVPKEHGGWWSTKTHFGLYKPEWVPTPLELDCKSISYYEPMCMLKPSLVLLRVAANVVAVFDMEKNEGCEEYYKIPVDVEYAKCIDFKLVGFVESLASPYAQQQEQQDSSVIHWNALSKIGTMTLQAEEDYWGYRSRTEDPTVLNDNISRETQLEEEVRELRMQLEEEVKLRMQFEEEVRKLKRENEEISSKRKQQEDQTLVPVESSLNLDQLSASASLE